MIVCLFKSTELLVKGSEVAFFLNLFACGTLTFEQGEDNGVEFATEFVLLKHLIEVSGNEFGFELEDATSEGTKDERIVAIEQGDAIDGTNLIKHHLFSFWGKTTITSTIFKVVGLVTRFEIQGCDGYDGRLEGIFAEGEASLTIIAEHGDVW